jgi:RNA polymerase sigma factor (sigma-70 family)
MALHILTQTYVEAQAALKRFLLARTGSEADADEILQDIYLKIHALTDDQDIQNPLAYLYRIGSNLWLDRLRQRRRALVRDQDWVDTQTTRVGGDAIVEDASMEARLDGQQALATLLEDMTALTPQCRRAFQLHKFDGMTHPQVAAAMGISRSAVEKHVSTALKRLLQKRRI